MLGEPFTIREATGKLHERVYIQGLGGNVRSRGAQERMQTCIARATDGLGTGLYEVRPGIVLGFYENARERSGEREIDLRGASLVPPQP